MSESPNVSSTTSTSLYSTVETEDEIVSQDDTSTSSSSSSWMDSLYSTDSGSSSAEPSGESDYDYWSDDALVDLDYLEDEAASEAAQTTAPVEDHVDIIDNQQDPEIDFVKPSANDVLPKLTKVYMPQNSADKHRLKINGIPNSYPISVKAGAEKDSVIIEIKDMEGKVVAQYEVYDLENDYVQLSGGAQFTLDSSLEGTELGKSIYVNSEPPQDVTAVLTDSETKDLSETDLKNGNTYTYTISDDVTLNLSLPQNTHYKASVTEESDGNYTVVLTFYNETEEVLSTVTLKDVKADTQDLESMTHLNISGATLDNPEVLVSDGLKLVFGSATLEELGHIVDEDGNDLGAPNARVNTMAEAIGIDAEALFTAYQTKIGTDYDNNGVVDVNDLNTYLEQVNAPTEELIEFIEAADQVLLDAHNQIREIIADGDVPSKASRVASSTSKTKTEVRGKGNTRQVTTETEIRFDATYASPKLLAAQASFRDRLVNVLAKSFGDKANITGDTTKDKHTWYVDGKGVSLSPGSECDNLQWGDTMYDVISLSEDDGEVMLTAYSPEEQDVSDYYTLETVVTIDGKESSRADLLTDDLYTNYLKK